MNRKIEVFPEIEIFTTTLIEDETAVRVEINFKEERLLCQNT